MSLRINGDIKSVKEWITVFGRHFHYFSEEAHSCQYLPYHTWITELHDVSPPILPAPWRTHYGCTSAMMIISAMFYHPFSLCTRLYDIFVPPPFAYKILHGRPFNWNRYILFFFMIVILEASEVVTISTNIMLLKYAFFLLLRSDYHMRKS